jgi:hypothetical protein
MFIFTTGSLTFILRKCEFLHAINLGKLTAGSHETFLARILNFWEKGKWTKYSTLKFKQYPTIYVVIH